jgi:copper(I)-binding protein
MARILALFLLLFASTAAAHEIHHGYLDFTHPWSRATAASAANGAVYMAVTNTGDAPDRLIGATTPMAAEVQLHTHEEVDGVMQMRRIDAVEVAPGETVLLEPGGLHLMLMGLTERLVEDTTFPMMLIFERAGEVPIDVIVEAPGAIGPEGGMEHHEEHETE